VLYKRIAIREGFEECLGRRQTAAVTEVYRAVDVYSLRNRFAASYEQRLELTGMRIHNRGFIAMGKPVPFVQVRRHSSAIHEERWTGMSHKLETTHYWPRRRKFENRKYELPNGTKTVFVDFVVLKNRDLLCMDQSGNLLVFTEEGGCLPLHPKAKVTSQPSLSFSWKSRLVYLYGNLRYITENNEYREVDPETGRVCVKIPLGDYCFDFDVFKHRCVFMAQNGSFAELNIGRNKLLVLKQADHQPQIRWTVFKAFEGVIVQAGTFVQSDETPGAKILVRLVSKKRRDLEYGPIHEYGTLASHRPLPVRCLPRPHQAEAFETPRSRSPAALEACSQEAQASSKPSSPGR